MLYSVCQKVMGLIPAGKSIFFLHHAHVTQYIFFTRIIV